MILLGNFGGKRLTFFIMDEREDFDVRVTVPGYLEEENPQWQHEYQKR